MRFSARRLDRSSLGARYAALTLLSPLVVLGLAGNAWAVVLTPGGTVSLSGTTSALRPELAGTSVAEATRPLAIDGPSGEPLFRGTLVDRVVRRDSTGTLDFYWTITSDASSTAEVFRIARETFNGFLTDVDFRTDSPGAVGPNEADRQIADGRDIVAFDFDIDRISPGEQSFLIFVETDATAFTEIGFRGGIAAVMPDMPTLTAVFPTFVPIPEPASVVLLALGLAAFCWRWRPRDR